MLNVCAQLKRVRTLVKTNLDLIRCIESKMFKQTATDLASISPELFETWLNSFDTVLSDCDGKRYNFSKPINPIKSFV